MREVYTSSSTNVDPVFCFSIGIERVRRELDRPYHMIMESRAYSVILPSFFTENIPVCLPSCMADHCLVRLLLVCCNAKQNGGFCVILPSARRKVQKRKEKIFLSILVEQQRASTSADMRTPVRTKVF